LKIMLHICCGPCSIYPVKKLRQDAHEVLGYFYNPNIHPYLEYKKRQEVLTEYAAGIDLDCFYEESYDFEKFLRRSCFVEKERCRHCYEMRLRKTALKAIEENCAAFTSTLLVSPRQKHNMIAETGKNIGRELGINFFYEDFRPGYREAVRISKEMDMYRQQYCGCIYSEFDRYANSGRA